MKKVLRASRENKFKHYTVFKLLRLQEIKERRVVLSKKDRVPPPPAPPRVAQDIARQVRIDELKAELAALEK